MTSENAPPTRRGTLRVKLTDWTYILAKPRRGTDRGNWHIAWGSVFAVCGVSLVRTTALRRDEHGEIVDYLDEQSEAFGAGNAKRGKHTDATCRKCRSQLRQLGVRSWPLNVQHAVALEENERIDMERAHAARQAERIEAKTRADHRAQTGEPAPLTFVWTALDADVDAAERTGKTALASALRARIEALRPVRDAELAARLAAVEAAHRAEQAATRVSQQATAELIAATPATPVPVRQTWQQAGRPETALYYERGVAPSPRPVLARFSHSGSRVYDARSGSLIAHYASPVRMWLAAVPVAEPASPTPVVIIPCGGRTTSAELPARDKHTGGYHQAAREAAEAIAERTGARLLILSALHGLYTEDRELDESDLAIGQPGSVTAARLAAQAAKLGITDAMVTVIADKQHADLVSAVWPHAVRLLDGARGLDAQLARMQAIADGAPTPAALTTVAAVPALFGAELVAPPAPVEPVTSGDLRRGDVCAPGSFGNPSLEPILIVASAVAVPGTSRVAIAYRVGLGLAPTVQVVLEADSSVDLIGRIPVPRSVASAPAERPLPAVEEAAPAPTEAEAIRSGFCGSVAISTQPLSDATPLVTRAAGVWRLPDWPPWVGVGWAPLLPIGGVAPRARRGRRERSCTPRTARL